MSDTRTITPTAITRLSNSRDGNPRWSVETKCEVFTTKANTGDAYRITGNETGRDVRITLDRGEIIGWDPA